MRSEMFILSPGGIRRINRRLMRYAVVFVMPLLLTTCIVPWDSGIEEQKELITIDGRLIRGDSLQTITITRSTSLVDPRYLALRDCQVMVEDDLGNRFDFQEVKDGVYTRIMDEDDLVVGREYMLIVEAPSGARYESEFEKLSSGLPVDSVYFEVENDVDPLTGRGLSGIQFYVDVEASDTTSRYFRWKLDETWEYTASAPITWIYDIEFGDLIRVFPEDPFEFYRCYINMPITDLFLDNTVNLSVNAKKKIPLKFVSTETDRLRIRYSLLVKQFTMTEKAYRYWDLNKVALQESGGLYTSQPGQPVTNLRNVNDTTEMVLGYFWVSSVTSRRLTFYRPTSLAVPDEFCDLVEFDFVTHIIDGKPPVYIYYDQDFDLELTGHRSCFYCTESKPGTLEKPDYWDDY